MTQVAVQRALVSVYDKTGLEELGRGLAKAGVEIVSTGSTAAKLREAGVEVTSVDSLTGFPECLDGRVKTLHPRVHAGILADRRLPSHVQQLAELDVEPFDLVVVNLYPFTATVASGAAPDECVEQIDIGGPTMVRSAAKNHPSVAVVVDPSAYGEVLEAVEAGGFTFEQRRALASKAFQHTAAYDVAVASWFSGSYDGSDAVEGFPVFVGATWERADVLRYGENPHQKAALYLNGRGGLASATQLHGKEMSYNNYVDGDAAWRAAHDHGSQPTVAIIKHANPCGIAVGATSEEAHAKAHATDPVSAFGGVIATNVPVSLKMAETVSEIFTEVVIAPGYEDGAVELLSKKPSIRLLVCDTPPLEAVEMRPVTGGLLLQQADRLQAPGDDPAAWTLAAGPAVEDLSDLAFAWRAVRAVKSNAILLASGGAAVGVGMGQVNRVDSCRLAVSRAGDRARGSVAASDAFFRSATGLRCSSRPGSARSCSRAARSATTRPSPPARRRACPSTSRAPATSSTEVCGPSAPLVSARPAHLGLSGS